jgi:hypothetical protein
MSRPGGDGSIQRSAYSGHKRFHCFSYQTVATPDGLIIHLYGPVEGRRHDLTLYRASGMDHLLEEQYQLEIDSMLTLPIKNYLG